MKKNKLEFKIFINDNKDLIEKNINEWLENTEFWQDVNGQDIVKSFADINNQKIIIGFLYREIESNDKKRKMK